MSAESNNDKFFSRLVSKSALKKQVYQNTLEVFQEMKGVADLIRFELDKRLMNQQQKVKVDFSDKGLFEAELRFAGDLLLFSMHSNVFEFPRMHEVMKTPYVKEDPNRSYCGVINIYNFLTDSFHFNRFNDVGYLVARLFVNKENFFLVEGKHQTSFYFNQFMNNAINQQDLRNIVEAAMLYSLEFDLLTPPYDLVKQVTVGEIKESASDRQLKTGKRLGFKFQADHDQHKS
ncbi:MAG: hypothetical protein R6U64_07510 [Bacteroidales bacterium]